MLEEAYESWANGSKVYNWWWALNTWNDYVSTFNNIGVETVIDIHQVAYDRWLKLLSDVNC